MSRTSRCASSFRGAFAVRKRFGPLVPMLFGIGLLLGLLAMVVEGFNPFAPWLLLAYVLFVTGILVGGLGIARWLSRLSDVAQETPDEGSPEFRAIARDPRPRVAYVAFWLVIVALVFVMVVKPLGF